MSEWSWGFFMAAILALFIWAAYRRSLAGPSSKPGTIVIHPEVDKREFSHLFAGATLDEHGREVLLGLMKASGMHWTPRESVMIKYTLGEISKDEFLQKIDGFTKQMPDFHDPRILLQQIEVLASVLGKEEAKPEA